MASRKKTGGAPTGARRKPSRPGGRTSTTAGTGTPQAGRRSTTPTPSIPSPRGSTGRAPKLNALAPGQYFVAGPFWSDGAQAWRVEYVERDVTMPGGWWEGSFYCQHEPDAQRLADLSRAVRSRAAWVQLQQEAVVMALRDGSGFIYRVMAGQRDVFKARPVPPRVTESYLSRQE